MQIFSLTTRVIFFFLLACGSVHLFAQQEKSSLESSVQHYMDSIQKKNGFPGMCASFILPDGRQLNLATGFSDTEKGLPMKPNTQLLSGSTPKMFYATVAVWLASTNKLGLDDPVIKYLGGNDWYKRIPNASTITIRQLLNHSSGIMEYYPLGDFISRLAKEPDKIWYPTELLSYVFDQNPLFEAGKGFSYADTNYIIAGLVIESVTKKSAYDLVQDLILDPLKLRSTVPSTSRRIKGLSNGYLASESIFGFSGATLKDDQFVINPQFEWCGGGYAGTTGDWAVFIKSLMTEKILTAEDLAEMKNGVDANLGVNEKYGLGLQIRPSPLGVGYGHGGWFPGYLTEVEYFPEQDIAVAIQFNTDDFGKIKTHPRNHLVRIAQMITAEHK